MPAETVTAMDAAVKTGSAAAPGPGRPSVTVPNLPIGYLRAFVTLLVVGHHAVLAYHPFAPPPPASLLTQPRWWGAFPVVDTERFGGFLVFTGWNEAFFMSLMFFLSGLFVKASLGRKGTRSFLGDRLRRLGLPFVAVGLLVAPLAYYPAYLATSAPAGLTGFAHEWLALGNWPVGPAWFLWLLFTFDAVAAGLFALDPGWADTVARRGSSLLDRPARCFALWLGVTALAYLPMALAFHPFQWTALGPFTFQTSRLLLYLAYFLGGVVVGTHGLERGFLATDGKLARRWPAWVAAACVAFVLSAAGTMAAMAPGAGLGLQTLGNLSYVVLGAASCFALLALFLRFAKTRTTVGDSLRDNAYGIYLLHYAFVSWLQYAFLPVKFSGLAKGLAVSLGATVLSWAMTAALRRVPAIGRVL